jgi:hypothetical protein
MEVGHEHDDMQSVAGCERRSEQDLLAEIRVQRVRPLIPWRVRRIRHRRSRAMA